MWTWRLPSRPPILHHLLSNPCPHVDKGFRKIVCVTHPETRVYPTATEHMFSDLDKAVLNNDYTNLRFSNAWVNLRSLITPEGRFFCQLGQCVPEQNLPSSTTWRSYTEATSVVHHPIPEQWNHTSSIQRSYTEADSAVPRTPPQISGTTPPPPQPRGVTLKLTVLCPAPPRTNGTTPPQSRGATLKLAVLYPVPPQSRGFTPPRIRGAMLMLTVLYPRPPPQCLHLQVHPNNLPISFDFITYFFLIHKTDTIPFQNHIPL